MENRAKLETLKAGLGNGLLFGLSEEGLFNLDSEYGHPNGAYDPMKITNILLSDKRIEIEVESIKSDWGAGFIELSEVKPYLFSMEDLTKTIRINQNEFVPLDEIMKNPNWYVIADCEHVEEHISIIMSLIANGAWLGQLPKWIVDELQSWHFNTENLPASDYIKVTNDNSPYK